MSKMFICLLSSLSMVTVSFAQATVYPIPAATRVPHFRLPVTYNSTTVLKFSAPVQPVDRGSRDILTAKQPGLDNVLKVKAAVRSFPPTNLHVFTQDGRLYAFDVYYVDSLSATYDFSQAPVSPDLPASVSGLQLSSPTINTDQRSQSLLALMGLPARHYARTSQEGIDLSLNRIAIHQNRLYLNLHLQNKSRLDYPLANLHLYIADRKRATRASMQNQELAPAYIDPVSFAVGDSAVDCRLIVPAFTLPHNRVLIVECFEPAGSRTIQLRIGNKVLLKAKKI